MRTGPILLTLVVLLTVFLAGGVSGYQLAERGKQQAVLTQLADDAEKIIEVKEIVKWKTQVVTKYVDKIKTVQGECMDIAAPPELDDWLFSAYSSTARSSLDRRLPIRRVSLAINNEDVGLSIGGAMAIRIGM